MSARTDIVVTTIFPPAWLSGFADNLLTHGTADAVTVRIITDRRTPASVYEAAARARDRGLRIECPNPDEQTEYLEQRGVDAAFIPWNTDNRRNIGFMQAWESGAEVLISIDDDNYCTRPEDFVAAHGVVGRPVSDTAATTVGGAPWFNICELLVPDAPFYARGFPYGARNQDGARPTQLDAGDMRTVAVNAGLWFGDPDVDAVTRLAMHPHVPEREVEAVALAPETWTPINTQNTALIGSAIPAYYYVRMGFQLGGLAIDRFGDIFSGYFLQTCAKHLGHAVRVGPPLLEHRRTPHDLFVDLRAELAGLVILEDLVPWLQEIRLSGNDYATAYASLADALRHAAPSFDGVEWDEGGRAFVLATADLMETWLAILDRLHGT